jgi:hypothetical protein
MGKGQTDSVCRGTVVSAHHGCRGSVYLGHLPICVNELRTETQRVNCLGFAFRFAGSAHHLRLGEMVAGCVRRGKTGSSKESPVVRRAATISWPMSFIQLLVRADRVGGPQREGDCDIAGAGPLTIFKSDQWGCFRSRMGWMSET